MKIRNLFIKVRTTNKRCRKPKQTINIKLRTKQRIREAATTNSDDNITNDKRLHANSADKPEPEPEHQHDDENQPTSKTSNRVRATQRQILPNRLVRIGYQPTPKRYVNH